MAPSFASGSAPTCLPGGVSKHVVSVEGIGSNVRSAEGVAYQNAQEELDRLKKECTQSNQTFVSCAIDAYYTGGEPIFFYATATAQYACY